MLWAALGSALVGCALAWAAARWLPDRFPNRLLVLATGPVAAVLGGLIARVVVGQDQIVVTLVVAACVSTALLSLLHGGMRPPGALPHGVAAQPPAH